MFNQSADRIIRMTDIIFIGRKRKNNVNVKHKQKKPPKISGL